MDLIFLFLLLRDLARTFRRVALVIVGIFAAFATHPFEEGVLHFSFAEVSLRLPQPALIALCTGACCDIVLAVLKYWNPKLFELPLDGGEG